MGANRFSGFEIGMRSRAVAAAAQGSENGSSATPPTVRVAAPGAGGPPFATFESGSLFSSAKTGVL